MAENRTTIAKVVQKHAGRAKEKFLQNLGKVDRTADEIFDEHLHNFTRQQNCANRIQKEFNNYIRCIRAAQAASKSLLETIGETYEPQWTGHDLLFAQIQSVDMLWQDFCHKLADQVMIPMNTYQGQFIEMRKKIDKRGRKLVDYDGQRHSFQSLQTNIKKRDDVKIAKGREQLEEAKRTYELLNSELHDELPALYDSRILFFVNNLQSLFNAEHVFHAETAKIFGELEGVVDKLATDSQRGSYGFKKTVNGSSLPRQLNNKSPTPILMNNIHGLHTSSMSPGHPEISESNGKATISPPPIDKKPENGEEDQTPKENEPLTSTESTTTDGVAVVVPPPPMVDDPKPSKDDGISNTTNNINHINDESNCVMNSAEEKTTTTTTTTSTNSNNNDNHKPVATNNSSSSKNVQDLYDIPADASTDNLPPGVLYRVRATYKYNKEDMDELSFDVGELIRVVEYDDPEEQEEGWLMGIKESTNEKGMFPANFTKPI